MDEDNTVQCFGDKYRFVSYILSFIRVISLTVRLHMGVIFDPSVRYSTMAPDLAKQILRTCCLAMQYGVRQCTDWRHPRGRPHSAWIHQICEDTGVTATKALELTEDKRCWRTIATAKGNG